MKIKSFKDLEIWQIACALVKKIYRLTKTFPAEEKYVLIPQIHDAIISVASNIAEGFGRYYFKDNIRFQLNARASLNEVESHILVSETLGYINSNNRKLYEEILADIVKLGVKINNYIASLKRRDKNGDKIVISSPKL